MGKEINEEKKFSEDVERLLAGREVKAGEDITDDHRTAIDFAKKLIEFRANPSPSFKAQLRERLLLELARQEAEARQKTKGNWFWEGLKTLVPENPVWRYAAAMLVVGMLITGVLLRTMVFTPSTTLEEELALRQAPAPQQEIKVEAVQEDELEVVIGKVIELNQTQTVNGLSITLEQMVLGSERIMFSAFTTPPDYSLPQDYPAVAEYTIDGITKYAGYAEATFLENGILLTWGYSQPYLDPVPSDASELVFTITSFGDWQGPWEFIIPLQD